MNVIADMLLPQRATLFGWAALFAMLYLLYRAVFRGDERAWLPAGIFGGLLPMIHTHSYFALGLVAFCWLLYSLRRDGLCMAWFRRWLRFGLLAAPQLMLWTLRSVEGNSHFLRIGLDWVNQGQENWLWFWLKNVGLVFAMTPFALVFCPREQRPVFSGAALIFVLGEIVLFQPNPYDNNKLFYVAYLFACFLVADFIMLLVERLKTKPLRAAFLALVVVIGCSAAVFTLGREVVSGLPDHAYRLFSADDVSAAEYIMANTEPDAVFLTDDYHNNTVAALTGRNIVCGSPSYLYYHGLDYTGAQRDAQEMLTDAEAFERLRGEYKIGYVYFGSAERMLAFCAGIQAAAPVDSYVTPVPWAMPGYDAEVVMAAGAFVQGSSIELSADGPIREPYAVYFQGGLTWYHAKLGILMSLQKMLEAGLISL